MIYQNFDEKWYTKLFKCFDSKDKFINEKYKKAINSETSISDADRFVGKVFNRFIGRNACLIDKIVKGTSYRIHGLDGKASVFMNMLDHPCSEYDEFIDRKVPQMNVDNHVVVAKKKYIKITYIQAVNRPYGGAIIVMYGQDLVTGEGFSYEMSRSFFRNAQFRFIDDSEADAMSKLLADDREAVEFEAVRHMTFDEMVAAKLCRKNCKSSNIPFNDPRARVSSIVWAKDYDEAYKTADTTLGWPYPPMEIKRI